MTDDDLDRQLAGWMAEQAKTDAPPTLREPAHVLATRRPSVRRGPGMRALPGLAIGATVIIAAVLSLRGLSATIPATGGATGSTASGAAATPSGGAATSGIPTSSSQPVGVTHNDWSTVTWSLAGVAPFAGPGNQFIMELLPIGDGFLAAGYETGDQPTAIAWAAAAGKPWVRVADPSGTFVDSIIDRLAAVPGGIIAIGRPGSPDGASGVRLWRSADGRTWTRLPVDPATFGDWYDPGLEIASGPGDVIAFARDRGTGATRVWHSTDGTDWTPDPDATTAFGGAALSIKATPFGYVATGTRSLGSSSDNGLGPDGVGVAFRSTDGRIWEPAVVEGAHRLGRVLVARDGMLAVGSSHGPTNAIGQPEYWQSSDGTHWLRVLNPDTAKGQLGVPATGDGDRIYVLSPFGSAWSSDGLAWHPLEQNVTDPSRDQPWAMYQVAAGPGGIVAAGQTDRGATGAATDETDALIWQAVPGKPLGAQPMPTPVPEHDHVCTPAEQNADGTCG
jgi:hypothetical protein